MTAANYTPAGAGAGVPFWSSSENACTLPGCETAAVTLPGGRAETDVTIDYTYDPLYRLTAADYSDGKYYHYSYDSVGNRLSQDSTLHNQPVSTGYVYDDANRLTIAGGVAYTWDANGNLLNDGSNTYAYDSANRLISVSGDQSAVSYAYRCNGKSIGQFGCESDRVSQTVNGVTTNYVLDQAAGLTQVLSDGTSDYLYGVERIAQVNGSDIEYFLTDGLGSVRQFADSTGTVTLAQSYQPYGEGLSSVGDGTSSYGFAGEMTDPTGLIYLRARYYSGEMGRFLSRDTWEGNADGPMSYNAWLYGYANPIRFTDSAGMSALAYFVNGNNNPPTPAGQQPGSTFTQEERDIIEQAINKIAHAYKDAYYEYYIDYVAKITECWGFLPTDVLKNIIPPPMNDADAFLGIHGGPIKFEKYAYLVNGEPFRPYPGETHSRNWISVYWNRQGNTTWVDDEGVTHRFSWRDDNDYARFIVHEMGHAFDHAAEHTLRVRASAKLGTGLTETNASVIDDLNGFCGTQGTGWQRRSSNSPDEYFGDMFIGWLYGCWETNTNGGFIGLGTARADFMNSHMPVWIGEILRIHGITGY